MLRISGILGGPLSLVIGLVGLTVMPVACGGGASIAPSIANVSPLTLVAGSSGIILISGHDFREGATVTLGGKVKAIQVVWVNGEYITAQTPANVGAAEYSVEVTNPDGGQGVSSQHLRVLAQSVATATPIPTKSALPSSTPSSVPTATPTASTTATEVPTSSPPVVITPTPQPPFIIPPRVPPGQTDQPPPASPVATAVLTPERPTVAPRPPIRRSGP